MSRFDTWRTIKSCDFLLYHRDRVAPVSVLAGPALQAFSQAQGEVSGAPGDSLSGLGTDRKTRCLKRAPVLNQKRCLNPWQGPSNFFYIFTGHTFDVVDDSGGHDGARDSSCNRGRCRCIKLKNSFTPMHTHFYTKKARK